VTQSAKSSSPARVSCSDRCTRRNSFLPTCSSSVLNYRAADEALALIDAATTRLAGAADTLSASTTNALASLWLAPRIPRFSRLHPGIDVRIVATNEAPDLDRNHLDIAIRFVPQGADTPVGERLVECTLFPVCAPTLARDRARPLATPADLAKHVRLDFETVRDGRPWSEWDLWFEKTEIAPIAPASTLRFSHYDHVIPAAVEGSGVAMGAHPHCACCARACCALHSAPGR
jgi:LysR family glycine cleavage system transcriptional activator